MPSLVTLMRKCQIKVADKLKSGKFSEKSIADALKIIDSYKDKIDAKISKWSKPDYENIKVTVKAKAATTGEHAKTDANVNLAILDGDGYKLAIGAAQSCVVSNDKAKSFATTFAGVKGADTVSNFSFSSKGKNYEKAVECLVAIDWEDVFDRNFTVQKHHSVHRSMSKKVGEGKVATASADAYAEGDHYSSVKTLAKTLAVDDFLKSDAYAHGEAA
ncbi:hypothetical protein [Tropicimonas marinistellae]|uniref:hypothetical protein n=1 Tax=Tropicimonas marinistellae TaxID=1739787 RepID=UPI00122DF78C|nr:hypothetical protein [Tropicimonas marinistellae]